MTVCIAVLCEKGKKIIAATDRMLSFNEFSADRAAVKFDSISDDWTVLWASDDVSHILPIIRRAEDNFKHANKNILEQAAKAMADAYQEQRKIEAEGQYLAVLGLSMKDFVAGKHGLSAETAKELMEKISSVQLRCQFLVCGFDSERKGHIFSVTDPGVARFEDIPGFSAIGSGWYRAMSSLFYYPYSAYSSEAIAFYHVCEAKFMAESAMGVGAETLIFRFIGNNSYKPLFDPSIESIKEMWKKEGSPRLPSKVEEKMEQILKKNDDIFLKYNALQEKKAAEILKGASDGD